MMSNQPKDELIGKTLGQYVVIEEIGRGGMATVYRAQQPSVNRVVALKVLPRTFLHDPGFFERFTREAAIISQLEHPHILPVHDYGQVNGIPYIVMRYLGGGSLEGRIRKNLPNLAELERPLRQICQALDYAHQQGIIHRDLKPGNILFDQDGNAYLSDFGIARVLGSDLTGSAIIGTPAYMSPEQARSQPIDSRSDVYSLGIVVFEWVTGKMPFRADTPIGLLLKQIEEPVPPVRTFRADISPQIEAVIMRACAKNPSERFTSAGEFFMAFSQAIKGGAISSSPPPYNYAPPPNPQPTPPYTPPPQSYTPAPTPYYSQPPQPMYGGYAQTPYPMPKKRNTGVLFLAIVAILAVVGAGILVATRPSTDSASQDTINTTTGRRAPISVQIPEGYVLYQGNDVQIAVPEGWTDVTTGDFINNAIATMQNVNPQLYNFMLQIKPQIEAGVFQIFAIDTDTGVNVNVAVEQNPFDSLDNVENYISLQYQQLGMEIDFVERVQLPDGEAIHMKARLPIAGGISSISEFYSLIKDGKLYSVTFTINSTTTEDWEDEFDAMLETFRITS
ncbi:MAG: serine/threonine-protein kinase [bacterium]|nr:serine/threonine-protein kinase [bacterium]